MPDIDANSLRGHLREKRQSLTPDQQVQHAQQACRHLLNASLLPQFRHIALFFSQDGELQTAPLIEALWQQNKSLYLPVLETLPDWHMGFAHYTPETPLTNNAFGIPEPDLPLESHCAGESMDLVLMPLVGFDRQGNRMGMGGGYYDRTFAFKIEQPNSAPKLIGWAHSCQQVEQLPSQPWDVPLDGIVTENGLTLF